MQRYCPNNSNFTFREITCAPPKCDNKKEEPKCDCGNCHFPPWWNFCPPINPPCNDKRKNNCDENNQHSSNCNKNCNHCCNKCNGFLSCNFSYGCNLGDYCQSIDPRIIFLVSVYPCLFKKS